MTEPVEITVSPGQSVVITVTVVDATAPDETPGIPEISPEVPIGETELKDYEKPIAEGVAKVRAGDMDPTDTEQAHVNEQSAFIEDVKAAYVKHEDTRYKAASESAQMAGQYLSARVRSTHGSQACSQAWEQNQTQYIEAFDRTASESGRVLEGG